MAHSGVLNTDAGSTLAFLFQAGTRPLYQRHSCHLHPHRPLRLLGKTIEIQILKRASLDILTEKCILIFLKLKGNKGGVSIRLSLYGHMLCFLNCHLSAHMNYASQRVDEFEYILDAQTFDTKNSPHILDHKSVHDDIL